MPQFVSRDNDEAFADRRRSPRRPTALRGSVMDGAVPVAEVELADISFHGLAFTAPRPLEIGANLQIVLRRPDSYDLRANFRVVSCRPGPDGTCRVGAEIT